MSRASLQRPVITAQSFAATASLGKRLLPNQVKDRFVENEYGTKFSFDSYGAKWLAFKSNI